MSRARETWWRVGFEATEELFETVSVGSGGYEELWGMVMQGAYDEDIDPMIEQMWAIRRGFAEWPEEPS